MASEGYHEPIELIPQSTQDLHRALRSLQEELEAVDWYQQRVDATSDAELKAILAHNRDEEKEHAAMVLEWIRRRDARFDAVLRQYLFTQEGVVAIEEGEKQGEAAEPERSEDPERREAVESPPELSMPASNFSVGPLR